MQKWVVELVGSMLLSFAWLATHGNPYIMGIALTSALMIGRMANTGFYSPLVVGGEWALGRLGGVEAGQYLLAQVAGVALAVVATPVFGVDGKPITL